MFGRRKPALPSVVPDHVRSRVARIATPELMSWADQAIYTAGRCLTIHQRDRRPESMEDAVTAAQVLLAVMDEMVLREQP